jgi:hypothetical protein
MSTGLIPLPLALIGIVVIVIFAYGSYWAFQVRSALISRLYRNRALWAGSVGAFFALLILSNLLIGSLDPTNFYLSLLQFTIGYFGAAFTFAWIDTSIRVARTSDPLRRNTLHWTKLRVVLWVILILSIVGGLVTVVLLKTNYFSTPAGPQGDFLYGPYGDNIIFIIPALILSHKRTGDLILRKHLKWLLIFVVVLFFTSGLLNNPATSFPRELGGVVLIVDAYCLYRATRSLAPVSHITFGNTPR